jgi:hypothetical protein
LSNVLSNLSNILLQYSPVEYIHALFVTRMFFFSMFSSPSVLHPAVRLSNFLLFSRPIFCLPVHISVN